MSVVTVVGRRSYEHSVVLQVIDGGEVTEVAVASGEGELRAVLVAVVAEDLVPPVHVGILVDVRRSAALLVSVELVEVAVGVARGKAVQCAGLVHIVCIGVCIGELGIAERGCQAVLILGSNVQRRCGAAFGGDHDHAVGALDSVDCGGDGVFEDGNRLDLDTC